MRYFNFGRLRLLILVVLFGGLLAAPAAHALIYQEAYVEYEDSTGNTTVKDDFVDNNSGPISTNISVELDDYYGYARSSVGMWGNLGVEGHLITAQTLRTMVEISSDENVNLAGTALPAKANFIIDGGFLQLAWAPGAELRFLLRITSNVTGGDYRKFVVDAYLKDTSSYGGISTFTSYGKDIGMVFDSTTGRVDIPISFQSFDLGLVPSGANIDLRYYLDITSTVPDFAELLSWGFSDPLSVDGVSGEFPTVVFESVNPVPIPGAIWLLGAGLLGLAGLRKKYSV